MRKAGTEDIPAIRSMAEVVFRKTYRDILSPAQMEYMMDMMYSEANLLRQMTDEGHCFYIEDGQGYVSFRPDGQTGDGRDRYHLEKLYVLPEYQGTGLGRRFFEKVCECVLALSPSNPLLELNVNRNNPAVTFYESMGMHKARQGDFDIGDGFYMNDYIMAIDLRPARKTIEVSAAVIVHDGKVFATQRGYGDWKDWWEFPGGKLEPGESPEAALMREIREELDTEIKVEKHIETIEYDYPAFHLTMHCFLCSILSGTLALKEHEAAAWLDAGSIGTVRWLPADLTIIDKLKTIL